MASLSISKLAAPLASRLFCLFLPPPRPLGGAVAALSSLALLLLCGLAALLFGCDGSRSPSEASLTLDRARPPRIRARDRDHDHGAGRGSGEAVDSLVSAPSPGQDDGVIDAPLSDASAPVRLVVLDKDGTLRLVSIAITLGSDGSFGDASCGTSWESPTSPPATDLVASADGRWVATFAPATDEAAGEMALFSVEQGALSKVWASELSTLEGAAVGILTSSASPIVLGLERAEQTSLLVVDASGSSGRTIGPATSFRVVDGEGAAPRIEGLITESDPPRLDALVWPKGLGAPPTEAAGLEAGALMQGAVDDALIVNEPDLRLIVGRSGGALGLFDEDGGVEHSPLLDALGAPPDRPLVQVAAADGRVAVLLASGAKGTSAALVVRDTDGGYSATPLAGRAGPDTPAPHVLVLASGSDAAFVATHAGLEYVPRGPLDGSARRSSVIAPLGLSWAPRAIVGVATVAGP